MEKEKIIQKIKKGKKLNLVDQEVKEIILKLIDEGVIVGYNPYTNPNMAKKNKYKWIGE